MMYEVVSKIVIALLVLGVIVVIHELGHFLVAKFFKIKVETFSVGFGPRLWGFRRGETDYRISAIPLGGFVKMAGENPADNVTGDPREFLSKPKWQRFLVASAGPAMNILLAVALLTGLYMYGSEIPEYMNHEAVIGLVEPGSPAEIAGIQSGDRVLSLDGKQNPDWTDVETTVVTNPGRNLPIVLDRSGERVETAVTPTRKGSADFGSIGMWPLERVLIQKVLPDRPASAAGLQVGDEILSVNGIDLRKTRNAIAIQEIIQKVPEKTFPLTIVRDGATREVDVTPITEAGLRVIGIAVQTPTVMIKLGLPAAFKRSIDTNMEGATLIFQILGKLFKREASLKVLDGPIGIFRASGRAYDAGLPVLIALMALISLNLGVMNLLPIPILDGGVMMMLIVESLIGHDLSLRVKERIIQVSFVFLLMLVVVVLYNDVMKLIPASPTSP